MKKVLSLVLAFAMILGSFGFVFASQFPDVSDTEYYSEPVNVLSGFGVIGGFPDGTFGPDKEVTRAQMATMIVNALGMTVSGQSDTKYSDVPKSHWASGFIAYATSVGFVAGYPDGTFKPDDQVTYDQALTMIVAALGYKADSLPGSWPGNFVNKAQGLGILDTCKTTGTKNAPRQDIACFLYDALGCAIGYTDKDGTWHFNDANGDNIADDDMYTRLGAVAYKGGAKFVVDGQEEAVIDMDKYFGAYVTAYAAKDDPNTIVAIKELLSEFIEGKVTVGTKIANDDATYKITSATKQLGPFIYFENGDDVTSTKPNYDSTPGVTMKFAVKLEGNKIAEVYSAQEWKASGTFRAGEDIQEEMKEESTLNAIYKFALDEDEEAIDESAVIMVGKAALADLAEDDIITVYENKAGKIAKLEVSTDKVEGTVTKVDAKGKLTIGGTAYALATGALPNAVAADVDSEGTFFLDYAGDIFDFDETNGATKNFAVVLACGADASRYAGNETPYVKMVLADGKTAEYEVDPDPTNGYPAAKIASGKWTTPITPGTVVEYTIDDDVISDFALITTAVGGSDEFVGQTYGGNKLSADTVIFSYSGAAFYDADAATDSKYTILTAADLKDAKFSDMVSRAKSGAFEVVMVSGVTSGTEEFAVFASYDGYDANGYLYTALYEGEVKTVTMKANTYTANVFTTYGAAKVYTLTFSGEKGTGTLKTTPTDYTENTSVAAGKLAASDAESFTDSANKTWPLSDSVKVYIYDESDEKWTASTKLAIAKYNYIGLIDSNKDGKWDIVLAFKD